MFDNRSSHCVTRDTLSPALSVCRYLEKRNKTKVKLVVAEETVRSALTFPV